jgi:Transcription factor WhiB
MLVYASFVDWKKASCAGMDTNFFYDIEEMRNGNPERKEKMDVIRRLCSSCPIFNKCMEWGFEEEEYGVWGGMTSVERDSFSDPSKIEMKLKVIHEMKQVGVSAQDIQKNVRVKEKSPYDTWEYRG